MWRFDIQPTLCALRQRRIALHQSRAAGRSLASAVCYFQHSTDTVNFRAAAATSAGANAGSEGAVS